MTPNAIESQRRAPHRAHSWPYSDATAARLSLAGAVVTLASDDSPASAAAARLAACIAERDHARVEALNVIDTRSAPIPPPIDLALAFADETIGRAVHAGQEEAIRHRLAAIIGHPVDWTARVVLGTPADAIAREARRAHSAIVVMGLRSHGRLDRALHDETTIGVMRHAACPVLGVAADAAGLPKRILVAMDFSSASVRAAMAAQALLDDGGKLTLAYVQSMIPYGPDDGEAIVHTLGIQAAFALLTEWLEDGARTVDHVVLRHERPASIASLLLDYADGAGIDMLAAGSARHGRLDRVLLGSVSADLARDGRRSTLIAPPVGT